MSPRRLAARFALSCLLLGLAACRDEGPVVPSAVTKHVMATITEPSAQVVFSAAAEPPADEAGWREVQTHAGALAASARRLVKAVRGGSRDAWVDMANALAEAAETAGAAAASRNAGALATAGDALYETCTRCHGAFGQRHGK